MSFWRRWLHRDDPIDSLIKPPRYTFEGHDESIEPRAKERREQAERIRKAARLLDTHDRAALRRVK